MQKVLLLIGLLSLFYSQTFGQSNQQKRDSVIVELCQYIEAAENSTDPKKEQENIDKILLDYFSGFPENEQEDEVKSLMFRLQRNCDSFKRLIDKDSPPEGDWYLEKSIPESKLEPSICEEYIDKPIHYYIDPSGEVVTVEVKEGIYLETYPDGSFSKLKFNWLGNCEFMLEFIESNHDVKKRISVAGDQYHYKLIDKNDGYFLVCSEIKGSTNYYSFKIYFNKPVKFNRVSH